VDADPVISEGNSWIVYYITIRWISFWLFWCLGGSIGLSDMPLFDHARNFIINGSVFNDIQGDSGVHRYLEINVGLISILKATIERLKEILDGVLYFGI